MNVNSNGGWVVHVRRCCAVLLPYWAVEALGGVDGEFSLCVLIISQYGERCIRVI